MIVLSGFRLDFRKYGVGTVLGKPFLARLHNACNYPENDQKREDEGNDPPYFFPGETETLVDIGFRLSYLLAIKQDVVGKNETDSKIYEPDKQCDKKDEGYDPDDEGRESETRLRKYSEGDDQ